MAIIITYNKVECTFPMVISSDFRMEQHTDDDHHVDALHFLKVTEKSHGNRSEITTKRVVDKN